MDLDPLLTEELIPEPIGDIDISLPSESYQYFNFVASGESGFIITLLLVIVDNETPRKNGFISALNFKKMLILTSRFTLKISNFERLNRDNRVLIIYQFLIYTSC